MSELSLPDARPVSRPSPGPYPARRLQYHKGVPQEERAAALERMGSEQGVVMVCTDAAARGLDVPDITHVVQVRPSGAARWARGWSDVPGAALVRQQAAGSLPLYPPPPPPK